MLTLAVGAALRQVNIRRFACIHECRGDPDVKQGVGNSTGETSLSITLLQSLDCIFFIFGKSMKTYNTSIKAASPHKLRSILCTRATIRNYVKHKLTETKKKANSNTSLMAAFMASSVIDFYIVLFYFFFHLTEEKKSGSCQRSPS